MHTMDTATGPVLLFPGQGGFDGVALDRARHEHPEIHAVFERIDAVTTELFSRRVSDVLFGDRPVELATLLQDECWVSQLAIYGAGLAAHQVLTAQGVRPSVLMGHSLGEITALVAAGAYSVEDGARIVIRRTTVIAERDAGGGAMVALATSPDRAAHLVGLVADPLLAVATENHDLQTVLSGPRPALGHVRAIAQQLKVGCVDLDAAFAFHNPSLADAAPQFADYVRGFARQPLTAPVYSPILQRFYEPEENLADRLADHFTLPVKFSTAVRALHGRGERTFVEAGGRATLTALVPKVLQDTAGDELTVLSTLSVGRGNVLRLPGTLASLQGLGLATGDGLHSLRRHLVPELTEREFATFWATARQDVLDLVGRQVAAFRGTTTTAAAEPAAAAPAAVAAVPGRADLFASVRALYAEALEYPEEVFTPDALLEAELGVDSVKQVELMSRASQHFGLPARSSDFRLADYETLDKIVGLIETELGGTAAAPTAVAPAVPGRADLFASVRALYAEALEYPEEVFTPDALLEAELGVDSVKQVELMSRASQHFGLPARSSDFRLADYETLDKIVGLIEEELGRLEGAAA
ncbi:acyltransferase domain-containing protein [Streptomyces sp. NPDC002537]